jgi:hypothetical protein
VVAIRIDTSNLVKYAEVDFPLAIKEGFTALQAALREITPVIVSEVFNNAIAEEPNFPTDYAVHLAETAPALVDIKFNRNSNYYINVLVDLDSLGGVPELVQATHYHAKLDSGGRVELPYGGEKLAYSKEERLDFFEAQVEGKALESITDEARVEYWKSIRKAPEWLFLQNGEPYMNIGPHMIIEDINEQLFRQGSQLAGMILSQYAQSADKSVPRSLQVTHDLFYVPGGRGSRWRNATNFTSKPTFG